MIRLLAKVPKEKHFANFITANLMIEPDRDALKSNILSAYNYVPTSNAIVDKVKQICRQLKYAAKHSVLCVIHHRDYTIRDWRSLPVFPLLYDLLLVKSFSKQNVQFLHTITLAGSRDDFTPKRRINGNVRPWFPYRGTLEVSFFLVNRDSDATFKKWQSAVNVQATIKFMNVWRDKFQFGYPSGYVYKSILDLFCHPEDMIYDCMPGTSCGFAIAARMLGRNYQGLFTDEAERMIVYKRLSNIRKIQNEAHTVRSLAPSNHGVRKQKAGYLFSRWGG